MPIKDKILYHQVNLFKLSTDISASFISMYFFWEHYLVLALLITFVPSALMSLVLLYFVDFTKVASSDLGKYLQKYMTKWAEGTRTLGAIVMAISAWYHSFLFIIIGLIVILAGWFYGALLSIIKNYLHS